MSESATPSEGLGVLHLFVRPGPLVDRALVLDAVKTAEAEGTQVVSVAMLGHKADMAVMALNADFLALRRLQTMLGSAGLDVVDSYLSITEVSEYAAGVPDEMKQARLYPVLPPEGKSAWCFYPMSKRRSVEGNWYTTEFERRKELMYEHGASGRKFAGRLVQLITASTGLDDYEWGVTLFATGPDDLKDVVYTMRFDEASAVYAEFGAFYTGIVGSTDDVLTQIGVD
ncbi:MAG: chlorite dismutase family protein [Actinomycetota bacterium]